MFSVGTRAPMECLGLKTHYMMIWGWAWKGWCYNMVSFEPTWYFGVLRPTALGRLGREGGAQKWKRASHETQLQPWLVQSSLAMRYKKLKKAIIAEVSSFCFELGNSHRLWGCEQGFRKWVSEPNLPPCFGSKLGSDTPDNDPICTSLDNWELSRPSPQSRKRSYLIQERSESATRQGLQMSTSLKTCRWIFWVCWLGARGHWVTACASMYLIARMWVH